MNIDDVLFNIFKGKNAKIENKLMGGMMNNSYVISINERKYVLYIPEGNANELVDRELEKECQNQYIKLAITSENIYFDTKLGIKVNEYIEGTSIDKINDFDYDKIAKLMHTLHDNKIKVSQDYNPFTRFEAYEKARLTYMQNIEEYNKIRDQIYKNKIYLDSKEKVLCHNDAQRSNIIRTNDDKYFYIDFEFSANNDPIYDIATFGNGDVKEGRKLLDSYFKNNITNKDIESYYLWRMFISLQWYNVAITKHFNGEGEAHGYDFMQVANHFLENAKTAKKMLDAEIN